MEPVERALDFESLYATHATFVRRALLQRGVRPQDVDDVLQETFVTIHRLLPAFEGRSSIETWLHAVVWRVAATYHRARGRREIASDQTEHTVADGPAQTSPSKSVHASLGHMEDEHRDVLTLHELAGFSISELAELTGKARATIRERLERGRTALARRMWKTLTASDEQVWLDRLAPRLAARLAMPDRPVLQHVVCEQTAISTLDDIVLVLWRGESSVAALEALIEVMFCALDKYPAGIRYLSIVEPTSTPPTREGRQLISWGTGKMGHRLRAAGWAIEDLRMMSLVAPIMNACSFVGGVPFNIRFFNGVPSAAQWLVQYGPLEARQISAHVELMRQRLSLGEGH